LNIKGVEDGDSGNDEPADIFYNGFQRPVQDVPLDAREQAAPSQDLARRLQLLSEPSGLHSQPFDDDSDYFQELPPEGIFFIVYISDSQSLLDCNPNLFSKIFHDTHSLFTRLKISSKNLITIIITRYFINL